MPTVSPHALRVVCDRRALVLYIEDIDFVPNRRLGTRGKLAARG